MTLHVTWRHVSLVNDLCYPDNICFTIHDWHTQYAVCTIACLFINGSVESLVLKVAERGAVECMNTLKIGAHLFRVNDIGWLFFNAAATFVAI